MEQKIEKIKEQYIRLHKTYIQTTSNTNTDYTQHRLLCNRLNIQLDTYELILGTLGIDSEEVLEKKN